MAQPAPLPCSKGPMLLSSCPVPCANDIRYMHAPCGSWISTFICTCMAFPHLTFQSSGGFCEKGYSDRHAFTACMC